MLCSTKKLLDYVKNNYVAKDKTSQGIGFLLDVLHKNSPYRDELYLLKGRTSNLSRAERLNITSDKTPIQKSYVDFMNLLDYILEENPDKIFVRKIKEVEDYLNPIEGKSFKNHSRNQKISSTRKTKNFAKVFQKNKKLVLGFILLSLCIAVYRNNLYKGPLNTTQNITSSEEYAINEYDKNGYRSPLNQITTWKNPSANLWAVWLLNVDNYEDAKIKQAGYSKYRDIKIMLLDDNKFHLLVFANSKREAEKERSKDVREKWRHSLIIPVDKCIPVEVINTDYLICQ